METSLQFFEYEGSKITFNVGGNIMVNVTEFAKAFPEKNLSTIINSNEIQEYVETLSKLKNFSLADLLRVDRGGSNPGTWANSKVALRIAQKLSPEFAVWIDSKVEELLTTGKTQLDTLTHPSKKQLAQWVIELEEQKERLQLTAELQSKELEKAAPKVEYFDTVLQSEDTYTTTKIAKELGMGAPTLNERLKNLGVQYKHGGQWILTHKYQDKGYTKTKTFAYTRQDGTTGTNTETVWTEKGREFIHRLIKEQKAA